MNHLLRLLIVLLVFTTSLAGFSQKVTTYSSRLSFKCDNDFFLLNGSDRYYTNGIFFNYSTINRKSSTVKKVINTFELGQKIFGPYKRKIPAEQIEQIDRPISGYLYLSFKKSIFHLRNVFYWEVAPGVIGPMSLGEQVQTGWHRVIGVKSKWDWVWKYQLKNELGIDVKAGYAFDVLPKESRYFQIRSKSDITLGTLLPQINQSVIIQLGKFNNMGESEQWNSNISKEGIKKDEYFFYFSPSLSYRPYDATVAGGLFRKDKGPITGEIEPFLFQNTIGGTATRGRFGVNASLIFESKEARKQLNSHVYGSIQVSYKLR